MSVIIPTGGNTGITLPFPNPASLLGGGDFTMMQLGPVILTGFEIPRVLPFGTDQRLIVNQMVGKKKRQIHLLGAQPRKIQWSGAIVYETAIDRARFLESLCTLGDVLEFKWGDFNYDVVIESFYYDVFSIHDIKYDIILEVARDKTDPQSIPSVSLDSLPIGMNTAADKIIAAATLLQTFVEVYG